MKFRSRLGFPGRIAVLAGLSLGAASQALAQPAPVQSFEQTNVPVGQRGEMDPAYSAGLMACPTIQAYQEFTQIAVEEGPENSKAILQSVAGMGCRLIPPGSAGVATHKVADDVQVQLDTGGTYWTSNTGFIEPGSDANPDTPAGP